MKQIFHSIGVTVLFLSLAGVVAAQPKAADPVLPSEAAVNGFLRSTFGYDESVTWKILSIGPSAYGLAEVNVLLARQEQQARYRLFVTPDGTHAITGDVVPFGAQPYEATRKQLAAGASGPAKGPENAAVTIVEFSDFQCPHCKDAQPALEKLLEEQPNVKFVFQNYPLPSHDWAMKAANYGDCVGRMNKDAFWKFSHDVFAAQAEITASNADEKLTALADGAGAKGGEIAACAAQPATQSRVEKSVALGKAAEVESTPTFFINGRKMSNIVQVPADVLKKIIEFDAKAGK